MKGLTVLREIHRSLTSLHGVGSEISFEDYLIPSESQNKVVVKEINAEAELAILLRNDLLARMETKSFPRDFELAALPDVSVLIEELSHFNTLCHRLVADRSISPLELEVQGEVDKFAVVLDWLHDRNEQEFRHQVFDTLFGDFQIGSWVDSNERQRYEEAHTIARHFWRSLLEKQLSLEDTRQACQDFFQAPIERKLNHRF